MASWWVPHMLGRGADCKASIERLCLSPYVGTFNSKVIKGFVPELRSRYVFFVFWDSYVLCIYVMNTLCTFPIFIYGYVTFILERVMFLVCEGWAEDWDRLLLWPKVLLSTIAALLPHLGLVAQLWVPEGPKPSVCRWFSVRHLVSNWLQPTQAVCVLVIF